MSSYSVKRLHHDIKEWRNRPKDTMLSANYVGNDYRQWAVNIRPSEGPYSGSIFHINMTIPLNYPDKPPIFNLLSTTGCSSWHPNVFGTYICLSICNTDWSPAYTLLTVLLQLQSFLFAERVLQDYGGTSSMSTDMNVINSVRRANSLYSKVYKSNEQGLPIIKHSEEYPWPPLDIPPISRELGIGCEIISFRNEKESWGIAVRDEGACYRLDSGRVAKKITEGIKWKWNLKLSSTFDKWNQINIDTISIISIFLNFSDVYNLYKICKSWRFSCQQVNLLNKHQLFCFYNKTSIEDGEILGMGLTIDFYPNSLEIKNSSIIPDTISYSVFKKGVRRGVDSNSNFFYFFPMVINKKHFNKSYYLIFETIKDRYKPVYQQLNPHQSAPTSSQKLSWVLDILCSIMNQFVVNLSTTDQWKKTHASDRAIENYCSFHFMLIAFSTLDPEFSKIAQERIDTFLSEGGEKKDKTRDLGRFIICLILGNKNWNDIADKFVKEQISRMVARIRISNHSFEKESLFNSGIVGLRLLVTQISFLNIIGKPEGKTIDQLLYNYEINMGRPSLNQIDKMKEAIKNSNNSIKNWDNFWNSVQLSGNIQEVLKDSIQSCVESRYRRDSVSLETLLSKISIV